MMAQPNCLPPIINKAITMARASKILLEVNVGTIATNAKENAIHIQTEVTSTNPYQSDF